MFKSSLHSIPLGFKSAGISTPAPELNLGFVIINIQLGA